MSSSRLATQVFSSSLRCRAGNFQGTSRPLPWALARGFQQSAVNQKTVQKLQQKPPANDDETLKAMDTLQALAHKTNMDVWSQPIETLDLIIPSLYSKRPQASILDHWKSFIQTQLNWIRNAQSMFLLAKENAFPGVKVKSRWSPKILSVRKGVWLEGLRREALASYTAVNEAVAARDTKALRIYTADTYKEALLKRVQAQDKSNHHVWKLHSQNAPPEVLSIRSFIGHMGAKDPLQGNRLVTQALIKFDTNQSLQIYNARGKLIGGSDQPKRVVEHLVFQKRGWTPSPWIIRDQLYETLDTKLTRLQ